jgi:acyl-CoA thioester hydrolase
MQLQKVLTSKTKIRFQDCDPFNHLNNAKYIDYFINAREDQIEEDYGLDIFELVKTDKIGWVVASNQIAYISPAFTMETVCIQSKLIQFSDKSLTVEMTMWNDEQTKLKALLWVKFIHVDLKTQMAKKHSDEFMTLFASVVEPAETLIFEERYKQVIAKR